MFYSVGARANRKRSLINVIGRYLLNFTFTANTSLTFPASGTLLTSVGNQNLTGGFTVTPFSIGTVTSGTTTPSAANGQQQYLTANGAFTLGVPGSACSIMVEVTNGASAGAITTAGYTKVTGDSYATTNGNKFLFFITKTQTYSHLNIVALQ